MNIVIFGAGTLGRHITAILAKEKHQIILIDKNLSALEEVSASYPIITRQSVGADWQLLDELMEFSPQLFIALTNEEETNLISCKIAKNLGYPRTIARFKNTLFLEKSPLDFGRLFGVDSLIGPEILVARQLFKSLTHPTSLYIEDFAHGGLQLHTFFIPEKWQSTKQIKELPFSENVRIALIIRKGEQSNSPQIIFPHDSDFLLPGDEVTFVGTINAIDQVFQFFNIEKVQIDSVVIAGGSTTALYLAHMLEERQIDLRIIEKNPETCAELASLLPKTTIINHDASDIDFLHTEQINKSDLLIAATHHDELNMCIALAGREIGSPKQTILLNHPYYIPLVKKLGFTQIASPLISATNYILSQLHAGKIRSLVSLHENKAVMLEINVSMHSPVVGIPFSEIGPFLPKELSILMTQNRGRIFTAKGNRTISPGDTVILVTNPKNIAELEKIF